MRQQRVGRKQQIEYTLVSLKDKAVPFTINEATFMHTFKKNTKAPHGIAPDDKALFEVKKKSKK
jgi:hypothetical protein